MWILESELEAGERVTFRLADGAVKTVGRSPGAEFILDVALVSRLHCRLTATDSCPEVVDLYSTNVTFVNGKPIKKALLQPGDRLKVGRAELTVSRA